VGGNQDNIQAELDRIGAGSDIEAELAQMKGELSAGAPRQLEANPNGDSAAPVDEQPPQAGDGS